VGTLVQNLWSMYYVILGYSNAGMELHTELKGFRQKVKKIKSNQMH